MERNPVEAVRNNALATRLMARIAGELGVERVRARLDRQGGRRRRPSWARRRRWPSGRSRRPQQRWPQTRFATVRFGNVLGSSGSVVPIFRRQIALGGPVTVTDERMTRYFMTIPEAVQLVIRSGSLGEGGEVFVLEMGEPVSIIAARARHDRAVRAATRSDDIAIEIVGRRPGEKLHEELFNPYERPQPTPAEKIVRAEREPLDPDAVEEMFDADRAARARGRRRGARGARSPSCRSVRRPRLRSGTAP